MEEGTWELLLKLLLGITDSLLSAPEAEDGLARRLCPHVLKVVFPLDCCIRWSKTSVQLALA